MSEPFSWKCPYCNHFVTVTDSNITYNEFRFNDNNKDGLLIFRTSAITCPNKECREYVIQASLLKADGTQTLIQRWPLKPISSAKPFPDYIPTQLLQDYHEACLISSLSPKASATLSRRCLQGMIRNFWGIKKARLIDEINALEEKLDPQTWQAIDAVRKIGNIGAHMEKDINFIIDVEPGEAELLLGLIETLLEEWYVRRHEREEKMQKVINAAGEKAKIRADAAAQVQTT